MVKNILGTLAGGYAMDQILHAYPELPATMSSRRWTTPAPSWTRRGSSPLAIVDHTHIRMRRHPV